LNRPSQGGQGDSRFDPSNGPEPKLLGFIPSKEFGLVDKSIRYIRSHVLLNQRFFIAHQNILDLNPKTEAVLAQYIRGKQRIQVLLIRYPNLRKPEMLIRAL